MTFMTFIRRLFKKEKRSQRLEVVQEISAEPLAEAPSPSAGWAVPEPVVKPVETIKEDEIAFSPQGDLEAYVRGSGVSKEAVERWISAGVLLPEETRIATKMIRIMCNPKKSKNQ